MGVQTFDNRTGAEPKWVVTHDDNVVYHFAVVSVGQVIDTKYDYIDAYEPAKEGWEARLEKVMELMQRAKDSGLPIPIPQFLKEAMEMVKTYINDDAPDLKSKFASASVEDYPWLDMRATKDGPSPREVATGTL